jgi:hypothetical protein
MLGLGAALGQGWALGTPKRLRDVLAAREGEDAAHEGAYGTDGPERVRPALVPARRPT